jgi:transposase
MCWPSRVHCSEYEPEECHKCCHIHEVYSETDDVQQYDIETGIRVVLVSIKLAKSPVSQCMFIVVTS